MCPKGETEPKRSGVDARPCPQGALPSNTRQRAGRLRQCSGILGTAPNGTRVDVDRLPERTPAQPAGPTDNHPDGTRTMALVNTTVLRRFGTHLCQRVLREEGSRHALRFDAERTRHDCCEDRAGLPERLREG
jgi:hypothetical protein